MSFDQELGARLRQVRQMKRISQECLGEILGVTFQQIQKYETGCNRMSPEKLNKCSEVFGVPVGYFFGEDSHMYNAGHDKKVLTIANAIASMPCDEVGKRMYHLILAMQQQSQMAAHR